MKELWWGSNESWFYDWIYICWTCVGNVCKIQPVVLELWWGCCRFIWGPSGYFNRKEVEVNSWCFNIWWKSSTGCSSTAGVMSAGRGWVWEWWIWVLYYICIYMCNIYVASLEEYLSDNVRVFWDAQVLSAFFHQFLVILYRMGLEHPSVMFLRAQSTWYILQLSLWCPSRIYSPPHIIIWLGYFYFWTTLL